MIRLKFQVSLKRKIHSAYIKLAGLYEISNVIYSVNDTAYSTVALIVESFNGYHSHMPVKTSYSP